MLEIEKKCLKASKKCIFFYQIYCVFAIKVYGGMDMLVNVVIIAVVIIVAIKEYKTFKTALSYEEEEDE